ncbi:MAG: hypothetical protein II793_02215, partial [Bacteroidales bacterium]|nr:hypothetical protein [Bacteroidales bacterium]
HRKGGEGERFANRILDELTKIYKGPNRGVKEVINDCARKSAIAGHSQSLSFCSGKARQKDSLRKPLYGLRRLFVAKTD